MKVSGLKCRPSSGFTAIELVAILAIGILLLGLVLPAFASAKGGSRSAYCQNNHRQLAQAWLLYAGNNGDQIVGAAMMGARPGWVEGNMDFTSPDSTNTKYLRQGPLFAYGQSSLSIYKCPSDSSVNQRLPQSPRFTPRSRSVSMSQAFDFGSWLPTPRYLTFAKPSDIRQPNHTMVFVDENPDSLNDGGFALQMAERNAPQGFIVDFPSALHDGGGTFSFSDGHVELHHWVGQTIKAPVRYNGQLSLNVPARDSLVDVQWLSENTTVAR